MLARGDDVRSFLRRRRETLAVVALLLLACGLRVYGVDWDDGHLYHPDERFILMSAAAIGLPGPIDLAHLFSPESPLIPPGYSYSYGTFALYLLRVVAAALGAVGHVFGISFLLATNDLDTLRLIGRPLSALFDTATVYLIYRIGRDLYGRRVALLGGVLAAFSVISIQLSHFYATDTLMTALVIAAIAASISVARRGRASSAAWTGLFVGLALATKASAAPVLAPVFMAHLTRWFVAADGESGGWLHRPTAAQFSRSIELVALTLLTAAGAFVVAEPAVLFDTQRYVQGIAEQSAMVQGIADLPYTRQYFARPAYLYFLQNLVLFGVGIPLGLSMFAGAIYTTARNLLRPRRGDLILLAFVLPYFAITGGFWTKFLRYLLPITPLLTLFAALALIQFLDYCRSRGLTTLLARGLIAIVIGFSAFYSLAFDHMYASPSPPVVASEWLYRNAPDGAVLATEHWEEGMPVPLDRAGRQDSAEGHGFQIVTMPMYEDDTLAKLNTIVQNLSTADYVVFFSNRLYGTVPRIPERYPMSRRYYEALFGEKLGFTLVEVADRYPNLLGVAFVDDTLNDPGLPTPALLRGMTPASITLNLGHADESFSVYDHQKVLIFQKTTRLSPEQLTQIIGPPPAPGETRWKPESSYKSLLLTPAQRALVQAGGTFRDLFNRGDLFNRYPLPTWIILTALIGLVGLPLGFPIFRFLPDRGYLIAKTLGVLILGWISWLVVSLGLLQASRPAILAVFAAFLIAGTLAGFLQRQALGQFLRENRHLILLEEGLFWGAFLFDVYIRSLNPDLWHPALGGEKPMDLAYLTAAIKSPIYPPYDPWFAGGYLNYYYFGQILVGTLVKISGIIPTTAYNLVVPQLFALTIGGAFTAALALSQRSNGRPGRAALAGGFLGALLVGVLGNLGGIIQVTQQLRQLAPADASLKPLAGLLVVLTGQQPFPLPQDWYWSSTRMLGLLGLEGTGSINEFPYFTFLFADLHAHLIALPFTLLVVALAVNFVKSTRAITRSVSPIRGGAPEFALAEESVAPVRTIRRGLAVPSWEVLATLGVTGLAVGMLYPTNTWDYPTYLGLIVLSLLVPWYLATRPTGRGLAVIVLQLIVIALLSQLLFRPFYAGFQSFYAGVHLIDEKSDPVWYIAINGLFLAVLVSYLLVEAWVMNRRSGSLRLLRLYLTHWELAPRIRELREVVVIHRDRDGSTWFWGALTLAFVVAAAASLGILLSGLLLVLLVAVLILAARRDRSPEDCLTMMLFATGLAISIGTDQVAIDGDIGRMNTIFKFYEQVWVLFGIASAVALVRLGRRLSEIRIPYLQSIWLGVIAAFMLVAAIYPVLGTISRVSNRFDPTIPPTLDGTAFMDRAVYLDTDESTGRVGELHLASDKAAIIWMQDHLQGTPTILEGNRPLYRWGSRFSIYTGLPTVIGWDWHQTQQRWGYREMIDERLLDVRRMYEDPSPDLTRALFRTYGVNYVILGQLERAFYPPAQAKFDAMIGTTLTVVYDQDGVRIYQVK